MVDELGSFTVATGFGDCGFEGGLIASIGAEDCCGWGAF